MDKKGGRELGMIWEMGIDIYIYCVCMCVSHSVVTPWTVPARLLCPWNSPGKNTGVGSHSLLQGIFPIKESNPTMYKMELPGWFSGKEHTCQAGDSGLIPGSGRSSGEGNVSDSSILA